MPHTLQCIVVTPEKTLRDSPAKFVSLMLGDGEIGIASDHAPMLGRLGNGEMRISGDNSTERYYVEGGFVEVLDNVVSILTPRAIPVEELDEMVALEQLETARARTANTPELMNARDEAVARSRAMLQAVRRAGS